MSILIPGKDPLLHRAFEELQDWRLVEWFSTVEPLAWAAVEARFAYNRPDRIFLVRGQTVTTEYAITHQEHEYSECEALLEATAGVPSVVDANVFLGHRLRHASASLGFEVSVQKENAGNQQRKYSVYLETVPSTPVKMLKRTLYKRLSTMHRYLLSAIVC